jgi:hypothetical protein
MKLGKYQIEDCKQAYTYNLVDGEGYHTISIYMGIHINTVGAMIKRYEDYLKQQQELTL